MTDRISCQDPENPAPALRRHRPRQAPRISANPPGAVAYDPKVVTIWEGFKEYFIRHGLPFDYVLYSNYERQVEANLAGHIDVAWNSPLAWVQEERLARAYRFAAKLNAASVFSGA